MQEYRRRFLVVTFILIQAFLLLAGRMWYLQILKGEEFEKFSLNNRVRFLRVPAPRGRILDRNGREFVVNRPSFDVFVLPNDVKQLEVLSKSLSRILEMDEPEIRGKIHSARKKSRFTPALIKRDITRNQLALIEARKSSFPSVIIEVNHTRKYPHGKLGASFLGYLGKANEKEMELYPDIVGDDVVGKSGVEKGWQNYLSGEDGYVQKVTDALGRDVKAGLFQKDLKSKESIPGDDVYVSVDLRLQKAASEALGDKAGAVVAVDVNTGGVLALVSHPSFDPRDFIRGIEPEKWKQLLEDPSFPLLNRATQGVYAPGSIFKIVTASAALEENAVAPHTHFYCPGRYRLGRKTFRCWKRWGHGNMDLHQALVESCDVYFYNVAEKLGIDRFSNYMKSFGFGSETGIDLNERTGVAPDRQWKRSTFGEQWYRGETTVTAIGQGFVSVTPIQAAMMTASVANGGTLLKPQIVSKIVSNDSELLASYGREERGQVELEKGTLDIIRKALRGVVNESKGTGRAAKLEEMAVAGKTGTAQVIALGKGTDDEKHRDHAWFVSYAPAENPEIAVAVLVEHGGHGGSAAAPIAKKVFEAYLKSTKEDSV